MVMRDGQTAAAADRINSLLQKEGGQRKKERDGKNERENEREKRKRERRTKL